MVLVYSVFATLILSTTGRQPTCHTCSQGKTLLVTPKTMHLYSWMDLFLDIVILDWKQHNYTKSKNQYRHLTILKKKLHQSYTAMPRRKLWNVSRTGPLSYFSHVHCDFIIQRTPVVPCCTLLNFSPLGCHHCSNSPPTPLPYRILSEHG